MATKTSEMVEAEVAKVEVVVDPALATIAERTPRSSTAAMAKETPVVEAIFFPAVFL